MPQLIAVTGLRALKLDLILLPRCGRHEVEGLKA